MPVLSTSHAVNMRGDPLSKFYKFVKFCKTLPLTIRTDFSPWNESSTRIIIFYINQLKPTIPNFLAASPNSFSDIPATFPDENSSQSDSPVFNCPSYHEVQGME
jgi:hypothetical protein